MGGEGWAAGRGGAGGLPEFEASIDFPQRLLSATGSVGVLPDGCFHPPLSLSKHTHTHRHHFLFAADLISTFKSRGIFDFSVFLSSLSHLSLRCTVMPRSGCRSHHLASAWYLIYF